MGQFQARIVNTLLVVLAISAFMSIFLLIKSFNRDNHAARCWQMHVLLDNLHATATAHIWERGLGAIIIGSKNPDPVTLEEFRHYKLEASACTEVVQAMLEKFNFDSVDGFFQGLVADWENSQSSLALARERVLKKQITLDEWMSITSTNISNELEIGKLAIIPKDGDTQALFFPEYIRWHSTLITDFAGRERALVGYAIASNSPIDKALMKKLISYRGVVDQASTFFSDIKPIPTTPVELANAIDVYQKEFLGEYETLRARIYDDSNKKHAYFMDAALWFEKSSTAIDSAVGISDAIGDISHNIIDDLKVSSEKSLLMNIGLLMFVLGVFFFLFVLINRRVIEPVDTLIRIMRRGATHN
ncbi:hypothetical protein MNBD_NITROSPINAE01-928 [hydrothermal vent metagenome]|uniref:Uncharacterized protein n=1 Tax=hydrothermal vent metagenome TaxID=652676 RepID=A0A3B1CA11_9ZZZZ